VRSVMPLTVGRRYVTYRHELRNRGISFRTDFPLQKSNSRILDHALTTGHDIGQNNFQIVHRPKPNLIKIVESVVIHQQKPTLNNMDS